MKTALLRLRDKLGSDAPYFQQVYAYTFDFARAEGQRSLSAPLPPISYLLTVDISSSFYSLVSTSQASRQRKDSGPFFSRTVYEAARWPT